MAYHFPLAAVLRVRELALEREEQALARIHAELAQLRAALVQTEADLRNSAVLRERAFAASALPAMHLHGLTHASTAFRLRRDTLREQIAVAEVRRTAQVARYSEAYRERETLLSLREKGQTAHREVQGKREEQAADEAFLNKQARARRLPGAK